MRYSLLGEKNHFWVKPGVIGEAIYEGILVAADNTHTGELVSITNSIVIVHRSKHETMLPSRSVSAGPSPLISDDFHTRNYDEKKDLTLRGSPQGAE